MTNEQKLEHFAARLDQLYREIEAFASQPDVPFGHGHEAMVIDAYIRDASRRLIKLAQRLR